MITVLLKKSVIFCIGFGADIAEVDIHHSQDTLEGKWFSLSSDELALLRRIAQSVRETGKPSALT